MSKNIEVERAVDDLL